MKPSCSVIPYAGVPGACDRCGQELRGSQRRWCSKNCQLVYRRNHRWTDARAAAKRRDKYRCQRCGRGRGDQGVHLEVNHVVPRNGGGYLWGCHHHLDGLETVCRTCHCEITRAQRAARMYKSYDQR